MPHMMLGISGVTEGKEHGVGVHTVRGLERALASEAWARISTVRLVAKAACAQVST